MRTSTPAWSASPANLRPRTPALAAATALLAGALVLGPAPQPVAGAPTPMPATCPPVAAQPTLLATLIRVPEGARAVCYGDATLELEGWGWTLMSIWPGIDVAEGLGSDFVLAEDPDAHDTITALYVFLPPAVALPDPTTTTWRDYDGVPPGFAWWQVRGHFDDPLAARCTAREGDSIDGVPVETSSAIATAFCRNHFVIESLTWVRDHAGSRTPEPWVGPNATATVPGSEPEPTASSAVPSGAPSPAATRSPAFSASPAPPASAPASPGPGPAPTASGQPVTPGAIVALLTTVAMILLVAFVAPRSRSRGSRGSRGSQGQRRRR